MAAFPRIYNSFADFERDELRRLDSLRTTVDDLLDERFAEELDWLDGEKPPARSSKKRSRPKEDASFD
ncbi:MAG TPA: hypothetical protein VNM90_01595 [Haliangium sp.]|nr:hypothetical protein [Haliangium sp.]